MQTPQNLDVMDVWKMNADAVFCSSSSFSISFQVQNPKLLHFPFLCWTASGNKSFPGLSLCLPVLLSGFQGCPRLKWGVHCFSFVPLTVCAHLWSRLVPHHWYFSVFVSCSAFCWSQQLGALHFFLGFCGSEFGTYPLNPDFSWGPWRFPMTLQCLFTAS